MKTLTAAEIINAVAALCVEANIRLRRDVREALRLAYAREKSARAKSLLKAVIDNAVVAQREKLAICQDTGMPVVFIELGQEVRVKGGLYAAVQRGVAQGYGKSSLRASIVPHPLTRGASGFTPAVIHTEIVRGRKLRITVLPKGFGCENKSQLAMFKPTARPEEITRFIVDAVKAAGPDACPPYVVGVGIGGTADYASLLAKKALLREVKRKKAKGKSSSQKLKVKKIEEDLLRKINALGIGPMGLGGKTTALAVHIETYPTHIAGLPVAVNISCHALRSASAAL